MAAQEATLRIFAALAASPTLAAAYLRPGPMLQTPQGPQQGICFDLDAMVSDSAKIAEKVMASGKCP